MSHPQMNTSKALLEIYSRYPAAIEDMLEVLAKKRSSESFIGENVDDTLQRVYKHAGYLEALQDIHNWFSKGV